MNNVHYGGPKSFDRVLVKESMKIDPYNKHTEISRKKFVLNYVLIFFLFKTHVCVGSNLKKITKA